MIWRKIEIKKSELDLSIVLRCGQTFRWKNINGVWTFALENKIILLKQDENLLHYSEIMDLKSNIDIDHKSVEDETKNFIFEYFALSIDLNTIRKKWIESCENLGFCSKKNIFCTNKGIRILKQDVWETLISFICSSNNNIKRISKMCDTLCSEFGEYVNDYDSVAHYSFPTEKSLSMPDVEKKLRKLGFGYRSKYIFETACMLNDNINYPNITIQNLNLLVNESYEKALNFLLQFKGVGLKVADCICLMSLNKHDVIPIDTHIYKIAVRDYNLISQMDHKNITKSLSKKSIFLIKDYFKKLFGSHAGWAQSFLFTSELSNLKNGLNIKKSISVPNIIK